jgi:RecB family exonuclease
MILFSFTKHYTGNDASPEHMARAQQDAALEHEIQERQIQQRKDDKLVLLDLIDRYGFETVERWVMNVKAFKSLSPHA